jgi:hypothetical protein
MDDDWRRSKRYIKVADSISTGQTASKSPHRPYSKGINRCRLSAGRKALAILLGRPYFCKKPHSDWHSPHSMHFWLSQPSPKVKRYSCLFPEMYSPFILQSASRPLSMGHKGSGRYSDKQVSSISGTLYNSDFQCCNRQ